LYLLRAKNSQDDRKNEPVEQKQIGQGYYVWERTAEGAGNNEYFVFCFVSKMQVPVYPFLIETVLTRRGNLAGIGVIPAVRN
jgi:hypothetical protein